MYNNQLKQLLKIEIVSLLALVISGILLAGYCYLYELLSSTQAILTPLGTASMVFFSTLYIGFFPVILFGAPIYSILKKYGKNTWPIVMCLGLSPGVLTIILGLNNLTWSLIGTFAIASGAIVVVITHISCRL